MPSPKSAMAVKNLFIALCLCSAWGYPSGDTADFDHELRPLDGRTRRDVSAATKPREERSLLVAARVVDEHGNTVHLRPTGDPVTRRVVFGSARSPGRVTPHRRVTSRGPGAGRRGGALATAGRPRGIGRPSRGRAISRPEVHRRAKVTPQQKSSPLVQNLPGSTGFVLLSGKKYDIRPHQGVVPQRKPRKPTYQHARTSRPANERRGHLASTNQSGRQPVSSHQRGQQQVSANQRNQQNIPANQHGRWSVPANQRPARNRFHGLQRQNVLPHTNNTPKPTKTFSPVLKRPVSKVPANAVYPKGYVQHHGQNARNMTLFLVRPSSERQLFVDRTKGTGTLHTSRSGKCPMTPQTGCPPLPSNGLPSSCSNDYQCGGGTKCCYDPCLTISKCVQPVFG